MDGEELKKWSSVPLAFGLHCELIRCRRLTDLLPYAPGPVSGLILFSSADCTANLPSSGQVIPPDNFVFVDARAEPTPDEFRE